MTEGDPVERLDDHAIPLERTAPCGGEQDIAPLVDVFADRRIVGMGEATHGTKEFFQLKHRLVRLLVTELDFRLFGLEANFSETLAINDYVVSGEGTPEEALDEIYFWTWNTEEMVALIKWMRDYNEGEPPTEKVRFYGFDMRFAQGPARAIETDLKRLDPEYHEVLGGELEMLKEGVSWGDPDAVADWLIAAETVSTELETRFRSWDAVYRSEMTVTEWRLLRQHRRIIEQAHELVETKTFDAEKSPNSVRDSAMAWNVSWILEHEDANRIALWAHNGHVMTGSFEETGQSPARTMGSHLRERYGDEYYALGFEFGRGSFRAYRDSGSNRPGVQTCSLDSIPEHSAAAVLDRMDSCVAFLDIESAMDDSVVRNWLDSEQCLHNVGAVFPGDGPEIYRKVDLVTELDGLLFVAETEETTPVGEG